MERSKHTTRIWGKLQTQLIMRYIAMIALFASVMCLFFYQHIYRFHLEREATLLQEQVNTQQKSLESRVATVEHDTIAIPYNNVISDYLVYPYSSDAARLKDALNSFQPMIRWMLSINSQYRRIHFLIDSKEEIGGTYTSQAKKYEEEEWYRNTAYSVGKCYWRNAHAADSFSTKNPLKENVATCSLYWIANHPYMVILDVSMEWLYGECEMVIDTNTGCVIYSSMPGISTIEPIDIQHDKLIDTAVINGEKYYVSCIRDERLGITIIACHQQETVRQEIREQMKIFSVLTLGLVLVTAFLLGLISKSVVVRMKKIGQNVNHVTNGDYDISYVSKRDDEIDELGTDVVSMAKQMNLMVNQRLNQQMLLREAEFRALQQQINPHFMFNTLQTMQMVAEINDQSELSDMIAHFGSMVRYNLLHSVDVPLSEEIENVRDYIILQKSVMNDELEAEFDIDPSCVSIEVPRLLLQPLVENAVVHGKKQGQVLHVRICVHPLSDGCRLEILNDGKQVDPEQESIIQRELDNVWQDPRIVDGCNAPHNLALMNIQKRLLIRFGPDSRLSVGNLPENGFGVSFIIRTGERSE